MATLLSLLKKPENKFVVSVRKPSIGHHKSCYLLVAGVVLFAGTAAQANNGSITLADFLTKEPVWPYELPQELSNTRLIEDPDELRKLTAANRVEYRVLLYTSGNKGAVKRSRLLRGYRSNVNLGPLEAEMPAGAGPAAYGHSHPTDNTFSDADFMAGERKRIP